MINLTSGKIINNRQIGDCFILKLHLKDKIRSKIRCGQFGMISLPNESSNILPRPFSIFDYSTRENTISFLIKIVGNGTEKLCKMKYGEYLSLRFPIGNGFIYDESEFDEIIVVAGGYGLAPFNLLKSNKKIKIFLGVRGSDDLEILSFFDKRKMKIEVATEDGSYGYKGRVTDLLLNYIERNDKRILILSCGPFSMMKETYRIAQTNNIKTLFSFEEKMACGTGVCQGCAIKMGNGYVLVCKDGPVFDGKDLFDL